MEVLFVPLSFQLGAVDFSMACFSEDELSRLCADHVVQQAKVAMCGLDCGDVIEREVHMHGPAGKCISFRRSQVTASTVGELLRAAREALKREDVDVVCECTELQNLPTDAGLYDAVSRSYPKKLQAYVAASMERAKWLEDVLELQFETVRSLIYSSWWSSIQSGSLSTCQALVSPNQKTASMPGADSPELTLLVRELQTELLESVGPKGLSALEVAIDGGDADLCKVLVESRANLQNSLDQALSRLDLHGSSPRAKIEEVCRILHNGGVAVEAWQSKQPWDRCLRAAATGCTWLVEDLLQKDKLGFEDVVCPRTNWSLALEAAVTSNHSLMKLALQKGVEAAIHCDRSGRSVMHYAALQGDEQLLLMIAESMQAQGFRILDRIDAVDELGRVLRRCAFSDEHLPTRYVALGTQSCSVSDVQRALPPLFEEEAPFGTLHEALETSVQRNGPDAI